VLDEIDLYGVGRLLALTSNDEANSLAAVHFADLFGRQEVYQLTPEGYLQKSRKLVAPRHLSGRFLFQPHVSHSFLAEKFAAGYSVKVTKLSEQFDYRAFQQRHGEEAVPLFCLNESKKLYIYTHDRKPGPKKGETLFALIPFGGDENALVEKEQQETSKETKADRTVQP
jgi:hypothetical protein